MTSEEFIIHSTQDFGSGYTALFYTNNDKTIWTYRVFNVELSVTVKPDFKLLTYEACFTHAIETVIELFSKTHNYSSTLNYKGDSTLIITYMNNKTNSVELQMALKTSYKTHVDKLFILRVLQALAESS